MRTLTWAELAAMPPGTIYCEGMPPRHHVQDLTLKRETYTQDLIMGTDLDGKDRTVPTPGWEFGELLPYRGSAALELDWTGWRPRLDEDEDLADPATRFYVFEAADLDAMIDVFRRAKEIA